MLIIHDARLPLPIIQTLTHYGMCKEFITNDITHQALAGHPDIFMCQMDKQWIVAPNTPLEIIEILQNNNATFHYGNTLVGSEIHNDSAYNVVVSEHYIIHNRKYTDSKIMELQGDREFIHVNQSFTRCSLLPLAKDTFLTSDKGIAKALEARSLDYCLVESDEIILPDYKNGMIGGCMGVYLNQVFICGNLDYHSEGKKIRDFLIHNNYDIVELYQGRLYDGGSLFFI